MSDPFATLVNLVGFLAGSVLYAMLLWMSARARRSSRAADLERVASRSQSGDGLWIVTGLLGLIWNAGAFAFYGLEDLHLGEPPAWLVAAAFSALSFLPAVVVHSVLRGWTSTGRVLLSHTLTGLGYAVAGASALLQAAAVGSGPVPSSIALRAATVGFLALIVPVAVVTRRRAGWQRALWVMALAIFAVSALHVGQHQAFASPWWLELATHHASLPLALAVLYQDYPFALGDLFLKRALAAVGLLTVAFAGLTLVGRLLPAVPTDPDARNLPLVAALLCLIVATALVYPWLRRSTAWLVDRVILERADYRRLTSDLSTRIGSIESAVSVLDELSRTIQAALSATRTAWWMDHTNDAGDRRTTDPKEVEAAASALASVDGIVTRPDSPGGVIVIVPTADAPRPVLIVGRLRAGRRLLSDDLDMLENVSTLGARRIDALRLANERFERRFHEQELDRLAAEAELKALRGQLNPHFLFNALTTIGYLIQTAPPRAFDTLMRLTSLLRRVLRSDVEETSLGAELDFVAAYLDIERARFEERLIVNVDVPEPVRGLDVPAFVVQTLVENAIKYAVAPNRGGATIRIEAALVDDEASPPGLRLTVSDTGSSPTTQALQGRRGEGVGLANLERRLKLARGNDARLTITSTPGVGTVVEVILPLTPRVALSTPDGAALIETPSSPGYRDAGGTLRPH